MNKHTHTLQIQCLFFIYTNSNSRAIVCEYNVISDPKIRILAFIAYFTQLFVYIMLHIVNEMYNQKNKT